MARIKTFIDGGSLLPADLDNIQDDYECAFGTYKDLFAASGLLSSGTTGVYYAAAGASMNTSPSIAGMFGLDKARNWSAAATSTVNPRSVYYNLLVSGYVGSTAPGNTLTVGLYSITGITSGSPTVASSPVTGSTVALASLAASAVIGPTGSGDFAAPAAGLFVVGVSVPSAMASGSVVSINVRLSARQV